MSADLLKNIAFLVYITSTICFILGLKKTTKVSTARAGNRLSAFAMLLAILGTLIELGIVDDYRWIVGGLVAGSLIGALMAKRVEMTEMPELVALLNGLGGASSALVALSVVWAEVIEVGATDQTVAALVTGGAASAVTIALSIIVGGITFTGSVLALLKLKEKLNKGAPIMLPGRHVINAVLLLGAIAGIGHLGFMAVGPDSIIVSALVVTAISLVLGVLLVIPIGGADMPVVVSLLNSYSGIAAAMAGFVINSPLLIVVGATVGAAGLILTQIMCVAMNRSLLNVLVGGFGSNEGVDLGDQEYHSVTSCGAEEAAMVLDAAESVIIIPGYGLAVAQAQHTCRELADEMIKRGTKVTYAIHPVAGRMPGHMNVLLAEADVPYEQLIEMDQINGEFKNTDAVIVVGANDVVNPANTDPKSPIFGMPILNAHEARSVFIIKRSLSPGYAGIKNELFEYPNAMMIYGDAKKVMQQMTTELKEI
ncbi:MAG: NAD(P)(+) transhydrogenase (Re/Si-specific) subunit beta [Sandaracinaceae bacterium]|jgi:NAD(P) transhydrogenase subunit beta|nr:NAD(P)(+) transhydrogenase (Re/Si-specific) subunit beta [Sandaracinaceae bacterium]MBK8407536.1 NAD(P)(+) transhydrogenase (Re/Si-specific) subunit beta [Sandaracinaceae bacterium]MBK8592349.1 NAD(P)(+) transhydrogenase (Re/Si-specific) subunit beta [Sandaracinaceae bacterium]